MQPVSSVAAGWVCCRGTAALRGAAAAPTGGALCLRPATGSVGPRGSARGNSLPPLLGNSLPPLFWQGGREGVGSLCQAPDIISYDHDFAGKEPKGPVFVACRNTAARVESCRCSRSSRSGSSSRDGVMRLGRSRGLPHIHEPFAPRTSFNAPRLSTLLASLSRRRSRDCRRPGRCSGCRLAGEPLR